MLSGVFFGFSWLSKESVAYLGPFVAMLPFALVRESRWTARITCLLAIGAGSAALLLAESAFWGRISGDPLCRLHATEQFNSPILSLRDSPTNRRRRTDRRGEAT
jgi:hypothetical protein